jgi:hypothetical protein
MKDGPHSRVYGTDCNLSPDIYVVKFTSLAKGGDAEIVFSSWP